MPVVCAECGEELMGSVNRCWRCGREFVSRTGDARIPPRRRTPIGGPLGGQLEAKLSAEEATAAAGEQLEGSSRWDRRGSPFAAQSGPRHGVNEPELEEIPPSTSPLQAEYPRGGGAKGAAIGSVILAGFSLLSDFVLPFGAIILAACGIGMAIWGLSSPGRRTAIAGLFLSCVAFAISVGVAAWTSLASPVW